MTFFLRIWDTYHSKVPLQIDLITSQLQGNQHGLFSIPHLGTEIIEENVCQLISSVRMRAVHPLAKDIDFPRKVYHSAGNEHCQHWTKNCTGIY